MLAGNMINPVESMQNPNLMIPQNMFSQSFPQNAMPF